MLSQVFIGCVLMIITTVVHVGGMAIGLRWLTYTHTSEHVMNSTVSRSLVVALLVIVMFIAILVEASVWAVTYMLLGVIPDFEEALYFSTVTYTTVGYGDLVLEQQWRLLSSFEAANGIIMFGWTTALIIVAIHHFSTTLKRFYT